MRDLRDVLYDVLNPFYYWDEDRRPNNILLSSTGDGYAITFNPTILPEEVLQRAAEIQKQLCKYKYGTRIGINMGPNFVILDLNKTLNVIGWGVTGAQRVMDLAKRDQILCSAAFAEPIRRDVDNLCAINGEYRIKHGNITLDANLWEFTMRAT